MLLQPRYPLFGGWTTDFKFGWSAEGVVAPGPAPGTLTLSITFGPSVTEVAFDEAELKVKFPGLDATARIACCQQCVRGWTSEEGPAGP